MSNKAREGAPKTETPEHPSTAHAGRAARARLEDSSHPEELASPEAVPEETPEETEGTPEASPLGTLSGLSPDEVALISSQHNL